MLGNFFIRGSCLYFDFPIQEKRKLQGRKPPPHPPPQSMFCASTRFNRLPVSNLSNQEQQRPLKAFQRPQESKAPSPKTNQNKNENKDAKPPYGMYTAMWNSNIDSFFLFRAQDVEKGERAGKKGDDGREITKSQQYTAQPPPSAAKTPPRPPSPDSPFSSPHPPTPP
jgi:hypothetical protein